MTHTQKQPYTGRQLLLFALVEAVVVAALAAYDLFFI